MALIKDSLWEIVSGTEVAPAEEHADDLRKFIAKRDHALAIVLAVDPSLYLLGEPVDSKAVWKKLEEQFQPKTWANKLHLRRKLYALKLKENGSVNEHIKTMSEIFKNLSVIGDAVSEEDRVVHSLASLPESYYVLVIALEAQSENIPKWEVVTERLLHQESKLKEKVPTPLEESRKALTSQGKGYKKPKPFTCHYCQKPGHYKKDCRKFLTAQKKQASLAKKEDPGSDNEAFMTIHALAATSSGSWIVDSGATCHMCNDRKLFVDMRNLESPQVTSGDGSPLKGPAEGTVKLEMILPDGNTQKCKLENVLYVPKLSYSLLSVSKASEAGKTTKFDKKGCKIFNKEKKVIAIATKHGNLYYLDHSKKGESANTTNCDNEMLWHRRYGHIGEQSLKKSCRW